MADGKSVVLTVLSTFEEFSFTGCKCRMDESGDQEQKEFSESVVLYLNSEQVKRVKPTFDIFT